jgi:hypothetical protein
MKLSTCNWCAVLKGGDGGVNLDRNKKRLFAYAQKEAHMCTKKAVLRRGINPTKFSKNPSTWIANEECPAQGVYPTVAPWDF